MKILVLNSGSSSLKYQLINMKNEEVLAKGNYERIGMDSSFVTHTAGQEKNVYERNVSNHEEAISFVLNLLTDNQHGVISSLDEITAIGHRTVHGGEKFNKSVLITDEVIKAIEECTPLAPLHNPASLTGINACMNVMPGKPMVAVFDTAFHQTIPKERYIYPIPYKYYEKYGIRKYGFHGTSHKYVSTRMNEILGRYNTKLITCHIGNGASISAVKEGVCINTSMGLTPNSGLMMGSRCGDMDATVITYMMQQLECSAEEMDEILNKQSGLLGISGISSDSRDIEDGIKVGNRRCDLAQKMFTNRIVDHIAKYYVELGGCDAIVFTAGIGENSIHTRREVLDALAPLGVKIDEEANDCRGVERLITAEDSAIPCYVIPTNEELMIARDTYALYQEKAKVKELEENEII